MTSWRERALPIKSPNAFFMFAHFNAIHGMKPMGDFHPYVRGKIIVYLSFRRLHRSLIIAKARCFERFFIKIKMRKKYGK